MANRLMLAPLTNCQSHPDGTISDEEYRWLVLRAQGGFGLTMTCAAHVQARGQGFPGQLGCFSDDHVEGLSKLAAGIHEAGSLAIVQLHHAGRRAPSALTGVESVAPGDDPGTGARALTTREVEEVMEDFVAAAERAERAGFDGVELHGAHDYLLCEFLNPELNTRTDEFGGTPENRSRPFFEIIGRIRERCRSDFNLSVRLSPERFGMVTSEILQLIERLGADGRVDFIDLSLWDAFKSAADPEHEGRHLLEMVTAVDRGAMRLAVAGKLYRGEDIRRALDAGVDMAEIGRAAITNHDLPLALMRDPDAAMRELPVAPDVLAEEGVSPSFLEYLRNFPGFVAD
jgi:2,4-dienoyl-CoA reductase-like NADH-dependent reductase (Old Yellow Enzyme family)